MGWQKGKPRGPRKPKPEAETGTEQKPEPKAKKSWTTRAGNDWDPTDFVGRIKGKKVEWSDTTLEDRFHIPREKLEALRDQGVVLQWVTKSVYGREETQHMSHFYRGGWEHVPPGTFGIEVTEIEGMVLMARSAAVHARARKHERDLALAPIRAREEMLGGGGPGVPLASGAGSHHRARETNFIRRSIEQIEVARDD